MKTGRLRQGQPHEAAKIPQGACPHLLLLPLRSGPHERIAKDNIHGRKGADLTAYRESAARYLKSIVRLVREAP